MTRKYSNMHATGAIGLATILAISLPAQAADKTGEFGIGVGRSDNIYKSPDGTEDETIYTAAVDFSIFNEDGRVKTDTVAQLAYLDYESGSFDSELVGGFLTLNSFQFVPNRFEWVISNNFGQRVSDPLVPVTPLNREYVNFFRTGPAVDFARGQRNSARLQLLYSRVDFEDSPSDNKRYGAEFALGREISRNHDLALVASTEKVEFTDSGNASDFDRHEAVLRYHAIGNQSTLNIDLGASKIETVDDDPTGIVFRLTWNRQLSALSTLRLLGGSAYSDEGNIFRFFQDELREIDFTEEFVNNSDPFTNNYVAGQYTWQNGRNVVGLTLSWNQADFDGGTGQDREAYLANFRVQREFSRSFFGGLRFRYRHREFKYLANETETYTASANLGIRLGPRVNLGLLYQYQTRDDTDEAASFDENRYFLTISYVPRWSQL